MSSAVTLPSVPPPTTPATATPSSAPPTPTGPPSLTQDSKAALVQTNHQAAQASLVDTYINASTPDQAANGPGGTPTSTPIATPTPTGQTGLQSPLQPSGLATAGIGINLSGTY